MPVRVAFRRDEQGHSPQAEPWRGWYNLKRWKDLRLRVFERDLFTCQCGCARIECDTSDLVCDHIEPHRGDPALFWSEANLQTLTKACHDGWKQRLERQRRLAP
ncbi:HNH endonuclease [Caulobacter zeae]|uniref:HNH endonuclease n=1 Tax=Caulobacter zeae TaxID=2055137 RepID=A0A2N5DQI6_9CAUL|nr:HNH endonuclease [Caulobacter zeae]